jgi:hypothetical protein
MLTNPLSNLAESFIDNVIREKVIPAIGSVVYCELAFGLTGHSGIYIGNNEIVHLNGSGYIEAVTPNKFLDRLDGFNSAISIYVSCLDRRAVGNPKAASRAKSLIGKQRNYDLIFDNCHRFVSGCLSGDFDNQDKFLWMVKFRAMTEFPANSWRVWDNISGAYFCEKDDK